MWERRPFYSQMYPTTYSGRGIYTLKIWDASLRNLNFQEKGIMARKEVQVNDFNVIQKFVDFVTLGKSLCNLLRQEWLSI